MISERKPTYRSFSRLLAAILTYSIGALYFGYSMGYFNSMDFKEIQMIFKIPMSEERAEGIFSGCVPFGALFGAFFSTRIISKFSRRQSFFIVDILAIFAGLLVISQTYLGLLAGRFLQGFCVGLFSALVPIMIKQLSPLQLSGSFGALLAPCIGCGFFFVYLFSYVLRRRYQVQDFWYLIFGFPFVMIAIQFLLIYKIFNNQTPKYLLSKGKIEEAKKLISQIYKEEFVEQIFNQKMADLKTVQSGDYQPTNELQKQPYQIQDNQIKIETKQEEIPSQNNNQIGSQLNEQRADKQAINEKGTNNRKPLPQDSKIAKYFALFLQGFHQLSGINVVVVYGAHLASQAIPQLTEQIPIIINGQKILAGLCGTLLLNRYGRRTLMLKGLAVILFSLLGLCIGFAIDSPESQTVKMFILACMILYASSFVITLGPITWLYIPEIVQPTVVPYTTMVNWVLACLIITTFPMLKGYTSMLFLFFFIITLINLVMCYFLMIETKGKKQIQVRKQFYESSQKIKIRWQRFKNYLKINKTK